MSFGSLCILLGLVAVTSGYKHVVFMHGILAGPQEWPDFKNLVEKYHPGTPTTVINMYDDLLSLYPMWTQVDAIAKNVTSILTNKSSEGTILICFSQGGLVCRGLLSILEHNVETFIGLSSPLAGQFGDTDYLKHLLPSFLRDNLYKLFYTKKGQDMSIGNYWYDPHHISLYSNYSTFLAPLNNQTSQPNFAAKGWRKNFLRLKNLVLVGGPDDGVITPWQSSHFGMYNANMDILPMEKQQWYIQDSFGLRTLNARGAVNRITIKGIPHIHWHTNQQVFDSCIKPWLS